MLLNNIQAMVIRKITDIALMREAVFNAVATNRTIKVDSSKEVMGARVIINNIGHLIIKVAGINNAKVMTTTPKEAVISNEKVIITIRKAVISHEKVMTTTPKAVISKRGITPIKAGTDREVISNEVITKLADTINPVGISKVEVTTAPADTIKAARAEVTTGQADITRVVIIKAEDTIRAEVITNGAETGREVFSNANPVTACE